MKNLWSETTKTRNVHFGKYIVLPLKMTHVFLFIAAVSALLIVNACGPEESSESQADIEAALAQKKQQDIIAIENNIKNSYARLAAKRADICPKLLQKDVGSNTIRRMAEVMVDEHCDYYLYLRTGQKIAITVNNSQIEALLIVPTLHNFADGDYQVTSYDKHVIRLSYNGANYKSKRLNYDVAISVID